jgi:hypothetical protein
MVTVLEEYNTKEQHFVVHFLWGKELNTKDIHNEIFCVDCGKCLSCKVVHSWVKKFPQGHLKVADDARPCAEWLRQQPKDFYAACFNTLVKQWDRCVSVHG